MISAAAVSPSRGHTVHVGLTGRLLEWRAPPWLVAALALPALVLVGLLDATFDASVRLTPLYLLPVAVAAWAGGAGLGAAVAVAAATTRLAVELAVAPERRVLAVWNLVADLVVYLGAAMLLAAMRKGWADAHRDAHTDALTGLHNLRAFRAEAETELTRARRYGHPLSVALVDLDAFKKINDTHGHSVGDDVLRAVARHLRHSVRSCDMVARVGGDEFAVLLPETGRDEAAAAVRHLGVGAGMGRHSVGFSVGVASYDEVPDSVDRLLADADRAMYREKRRNRGAA
jgi:diguanylate cyclase (GGDEF)-like protein